MSVRDRFMRLWYLRMRPAPDQIVDGLCGARADDLLLFIIECDASALHLQSALCGALQAACARRHADVQPELTPTAKKTTPAKKKAAPAKSSTATKKKKPRS